MRGVVSEGTGGMLGCEGGRGWGGCEGGAGME